MPAKTRCRACDKYGPLPFLRKWGTELGGVLAMGMTPTLLRGHSAGITLRHYTISSPSYTLLLLLELELLAHSLTSTVSVSTAHRCVAQCVWGSELGVFFLSFLSQLKQAIVPAAYSYGA